MQLTPVPRAPIAPATADAIERAAWQDAFDAAPAADRARLGLEAIERGPVLVLRAPGVDHVLFNRVYGLDRASPDAMLDSAVAGYTADGIDRFFIHVAAADASGLEARLRRRGVERFHRAWIKLVRGAGPAPAVERPYAIRPPAGHELDDAVRILLDGFDLPDAAAPVLAALANRERWRFVVARDQDRVVASSLAFADSQIAYLAMTATAPSHRGRGAQPALIADRVRWGLERGCRAFVSETGEAVASEPNPSEANLRAAGFAPLAARLNYAPRGTTWARR